MVTRRELATALELSAEAQEAPDQPKKSVRGHPIIRKKEKKKEEP